MLKVFLSFILGLATAVVVIWNSVGSMMFSEIESPFTVEETVARIQQNIMQAGNGWSISGLRNPIKPLQNEGVNALPVLLIEACSTQYSAPILKDDKVRFLSLLMPCKISVYKKNDGKVYIGILNAGLIASFFGSNVSSVMEHVVADQKRFLIMDPSKPAPAMIQPKPAGGTGGGAGAPGEGC